MRHHIDQSIREHEREQCAANQSNAKREMPDGRIKSRAKWKKLQPTDELMKSCSGDDWSQEQNYESQSEYLGSDTSSWRTENIKKEIPCMIIYTTLLERER